MSLGADITFFSLFMKFGGSPKEGGGGGRGGGVLALRAPSPGSIPEKYQLLISFTR